MSPLRPDVQIFMRIIICNLLILICLIRFSHEIESLNKQDDVFGCTGDNVSLNFVYNTSQKVQVKTWHYGELSNKSFIATYISGGLDSISKFKERLQLGNRTNGAIILNKVGKNDEGSYTCKIVTGTNNKTSYYQINLAVYDPPKEAPYFKEERNKNGEVTKIICSRPKKDGNPKVKIFLKYENGTRRDSLTVDFDLKKKYQCCMEGQSAECAKNISKCRSYSRGGSNESDVGGDAQGKNSCHAGSCITKSIIWWIIIIAVISFIVCCAKWKCMSNDEPNVGTCRRMFCATGICRCKGRQNNGDRDGNATTCKNTVCWKTLVVSLLITVVSYAGFAFPFCFCVISEDLSVGEREAIVTIGPPILSVLIIVALNHVLKKRNGRGDDTGGSDIRDDNTDDANQGSDTRDDNTEDARQDDNDGNEDEPCIKAKNKDTYIESIPMVNQKDKHVPDVAAAISDLDVKRAAAMSDLDGKRNQSD